MSGELLCERCGQNHPIWYTDNKSWNEVVRDNSSNFVFNFLCPSCFCFLAFVHYREVSFKVTLERAADNKEPVQQPLTQAKAAEALPERKIAPMCGNCMSESCLYTISVGSDECIKRFKPVRLLLV